MTKVIWYPHAPSQLDHCIITSNLLSPTAVSALAFEFCTQVTRNSVGRAGVSGHLKEIISDRGPRPVSSIFAETAIVYVCPASSPCCPLREPRSIIYGNGRA